MTDLLLRQYKRVRSLRKKEFRYKDIKDVYVIVFFEKSPEEFHAFPDTYCHFFGQKSDTGLHLDLLEKFIVTAHSYLLHSNDSFAGSFKILLRKRSLLTLESHSYAT